MSTFTIAGQVTLGGVGLNGVTVTVTRVSGTADASSPYTFTTAGAGGSAGDYTGGTLVTGTTYSVVATDSALTFSTVANQVVASANITGINFTLTPTISLSQTSANFSGPNGQELLLTSTVGNDVAGTTTWLSSNSAIASVTAGLVSVKTAGTVTITAKVTDDVSVTATCSVVIGANTTVYLSQTSVNLIQNLLQAQLQAGYANQSFTSSQSADIIAALAQLRNNQ